MAATRANRRPRGTEETAHAPEESLREYRAKRDFRVTPEPAAGPAPPHKHPIFVVQEHHASRLHYDFRLEADGVLKSWAVPRGPSLDPSEKRLAVRVEDHPLSYATFSGTIPEGHYGAGTVAVWDHGTYENLRPDRTVTEGIEAGRLEFRMHGDKLRGKFALVRMGGKGRRKENWLLIKMHDEFARADAAPSTKPTPRRRTPEPVAARPSRGSDTPPDEITLTHPDKVLFPDEGITKRDVFAYYRRAAPWLLPHLRDRPVTLEFLPEGLGEDRPHFWQKNTPSSYPAWVPRVELPGGRGKQVSYVLVNDLQTLLYLVNRGALTFHTWLSRTGDLDRPDFVLFDLDPGGRAGPRPVAAAVPVARRLREVLRAEGHDACVKTSGKRGLHVMVPWRQEGGFDEAREWARGVAGRVVGAMPDAATLEVRKDKRGDKVYLDVLQNARGHHAVPPYVVRAVPGAPVSMPLTWRQLRDDLDPGAFTLRTVPARLARRKEDPMALLLAGAALDRRG